MRASAIEFRFRMIIHLVIIVLGFWAPWIEPLHLHRTSLLEWLALEITRLGLVSFAVATPIVIALATLIAALSAWMRVWGTAYLDPSVVTGLAMDAGGVMTSGPYRYVRNPLYLGTIFMAAAMAFAMPVTGAVFAVILTPLFDLRLILGEEKFLGEKLGEPYQAYLRAVPRLIPRLRTTLPPSSHAPHWLHSILTELLPIGVFLVTAVLWWRYDSSLVGLAFFVAFCVSIAVRGFLIRPLPTAIAVVCLVVLAEVEKIAWFKATVISFGVWLVLRAFLTSPQKVISQK